MLCHAIPTGDMFTGIYYIRNIHAEVVVPCEERCERRLAVHADNARPHTAKVRRAFYGDNFLRIAPHPPHPPDPAYSPDLAPSDFFISCVGISKTDSNPRTAIQVCI
jgi:hypothetical protein